LQPATIEELRAAPIPNIKHDASRLVEMLITEAEDETATALTE
jgi:hypothetical protein